MASKVGDPSQRLQRFLTLYMILTLPDCQISNVVAVSRRRFEHSSTFLWSVNTVSEKIFHLSHRHEAIFQSDATSSAIFEHTLIIIYPVRETAQCCPKRRRSSL